MSRSFKTNRRKRFLSGQKDDKPLMERIEEWSEKFLLNVPVEVFLTRKKELNNLIVLEALEKGITLFER